MKELFRHHDFTRVGYYQTVLEAAGIPTFVRNQHATTNITDIPIPEFYPALCVVNDDDYAKAVEVLRTQVSTDDEMAQAEIDCPKCGEKNPGNFDVCWNCESPLS